MRAQAKEADDRLLIEAAQKDPARFVELYEENFERVYAFVSRRVHSRADVEDITAEVFQQALANLRRLSGAVYLSPPGFTASRANAVADRWQNLARENGRPIMDAPLDGFDQTTKSSEPSAARQLFRYVAELPAEQRRVIEMRFGEEKSIREIARGAREIERVPSSSFSSVPTQIARAGFDKSRENKAGGRNG